MPVRKVPSVLNLQINLKIVLNLQINLKIVDKWINTAHSITPQEKRDL